MPIVTSEAVAAHLNIANPSREQLVKLQEHTDAALGHVARRCGPLEPTTLAVRADGDFLILPAGALAEVAAVRAPDGVEVTPDDVDLEAGVIELPFARRGTWQVDVVPRQVPAELVLAVKIIAGHLWETQRGRSDPQRSVMHAAGGGDVPRAAPSGFAIPSRAADLMAPYLLPGFA